MNRVWCWWTSYWFRPRLVTDLAVCRLLWVGYQLFHLLMFVDDDMAGVAEVPQELFQPNLIMRVILKVMGGAAQAPLDVVPAIYGLTVVAGVLALIGCATNLSVAAGRRPR